MMKTLVDNIILARSGDGELRHNRAMKKLYTASELMRLTGMTRKQISYWDKIGLVSPIMRDSTASHGKPSLFFTASEVLKAMVACELRHAGFRPRQVRQVVRNLAESGLRLGETESYLVTDGHSVYIALSDTEAMDILKHHRQLLLLLPLHEQVAKLRLAA